ncbi:MAG: hypothetical protein V1708_00505 [Candidatus Micrarchaeota archaeon]
MKTELQNKLFKKYPKIFRQRKLSMRQTAMCWGIDCGDGWYALIDELCGSIQRFVDCNKLDQVEAVQVKEKFGGLGFYVGSAPEYIHGEITFAEEISYLFCEDCGASPAGLDNKPGGWYRTLCEKCRTRLGNSETPSKSKKRQ